MKDHHIRTVFLNSAQIGEILDRLDGPVPPSVPGLVPGVQERRRHPRLRYRQTNIRVTVEHPAGGLSHLKVIARNLSCGGIAFLHGGYLHPKSKCTFTLPRLDATHQIVEGIVVSCRHLDGAIHGVGVGFGQEIDPAEFIGPKHLLSQTPEPVTENEMTYFEQLIRNVERASTELVQVVNPPNLAMAMEICTDLAVSASGLNCTGILTAARVAIAHLEATASVAAAAPALCELRQLCSKIGNWAQSDEAVLGAGAEHSEGEC